MSQLGPLVFEPGNINALVMDKVRKNGYNSLTSRERKWYRVMRERERAAQRGYISSRFRGRNTVAPSPPPPVDPIEESRKALNRRLKSTLRKARSAERRQNRRTQRQLWQQLANIGQEYQRQGRRYSERMRNLKAELEAEAVPRPIPVARPVFPRGVLSPAPAPAPVPVQPQTLPLSIKMPVPRQETVALGPPATWRELPPLEGGSRRRTRKNKTRRRK